MSRGPNHRPDKGFSREIKKLSDQKQALKKDPSLRVKDSKPVPTFQWRKALVEPTATSMATPHRLSNQSAVKPAKPEFTKQQRAYADSKQGKS